MNKVYKDKWLTALRSGKYRQATGRLRCDVGFCCLGVLMNTYDINGWDQSDSSNTYHKSNKFGYCDGLREGEDLYGEVSQDSELTSETLSIFGISEDEQCRLINMNDKEGNNFNEIADYIEESM